MNPEHLVNVAKTGGTIRQRMENIAEAVERRLQSLEQTDDGMYDPIGKIARNPKKTRGTNQEKTMIVGKNDVVTLVSEHGGEAITMTRNGHGDTRETDDAFVSRVNREALAFATKRSSDVWILTATGSVHVPVVRAKVDTDLFFGKEG